MPDHPPKPAGHEAGSRTASRLQGFRASQTRALIPPALAIFFLSCSGPDPKPAADPSSPKERIRRLVAQVDANLFGETEEAVARLAATGRAGVPFIHEELKAAGEKSRPVLARALESVYATDPYYLVRAPDRRVTARLKSASRKEAYDELFRDFSVRPRFLLQDDTADPAPAATIWIDDLSYWETVRRFCLSYAMDLDGGVFEPGIWRGWSEPHGPFIVRAEKAGEENRLTLRLHLQPGTAPIDGELRSLRVTDAAGREIDGATSVLVEDEGGNFMPLTSHSASATLGGADLTIPEGRAGPFTVTGNARILLPSEVEAAVWTLENWSEDPERTVGGCRLALKNFEACNFRFSGPAKPSAWEHTAWVFLSGDRGRLKNASRITLAGSGEVGGASWPHDTPFTRITVVRPAKSEVVEFPFEIKVAGWR